jgi:hypothetical protein
VERDERDEHAEQALTIACDEKEDRNVVRFYLTAAALTAGLILSGLLSLLLVAVTPALLDRLPFPDFWREAASLCAGHAQ